MGYGTHVLTVCPLHAAVLNRCEEHASCECLPNNCLSIGERKRKIYINSHIFFCDSGVNSFVATPAVHRPTRHPYHIYWPLSRRVSFISSKGTNYCVWLPDALSPLPPLPSPLTFSRDVLKLPECTTVLDQHLAEEIKVVKHARDFALARAKADEEYAKKLFALNTKFGKIQVTEEYEKSPIWKVWEQTWKSSDDYAAHLADKSGDAQQSVQDQLTPLIDMKEAGRTNFVATRKRIDGALAKSQKELDDKEKKYMAAVKKMDTVIDKFEIAREKGGKAVSGLWAWYPPLF